MKYVIETPNKQYTGVTEGVAFVDGRAIVEDEVLKNVLVNNYGYSARPLDEKKGAEKVEAAEKKPAKRKK